ncbi:MAG: membrane protein insertase YidC, partial [Algiphilus sp.]
MENRRFILICAFGVLLFLIFQAWQSDQAQQAPAQQVAQSDRIPPDADMPEPAQPAQDESAAMDDTPQPARPARSAPSDAPGTENDAGFIAVETDVVRARIALKGGDIRQLLLLDYPESEANPRPLPILDDRRETWSIVQSGVLAPQGNPATQRSLYTSNVDQAVLADGEDSLTISLRTTSGAGVTVVKRYTFHRGRYVVDLSHEVVNDSDRAIDASAFTQLWRNDHTLGDQPPFAPTFTGYGFYEARDGGAKYGFEKIDFKDVRESPVRVDQRGGWLAMMQHYFIVAALPPQDGQLNFTAKPSSRFGYLGQVVGEARTIDPGASETFHMELFAGPKLQKRLDDVAPGFDLTIDYGILTPLSAPLFWVLDLLHSLLGNWGWAIVVLTLLVKTAMYKLSEAQFRSFGKMRHFG